MLAAARMGRSRLLFALLLALIGMSAAVAPAAATGYATAQSAPVLGATVSNAPSIQDELRDWLRVSGTARHTQATATPDTWSAVCAQIPGEGEARGRRLLGESGATGLDTGTGTSRSSRAPPLA